MQNGSEAVSQNRMDDLVGGFDGASKSDDVGGSNGIKGMKPRERNIIKLGKGKLPSSGKHAESDVGALMSSPECISSFTLRKISERNADTVGLQNNVSKLPDIKAGLSGESNRSSKQEPTASDALLRTQVQDSLSGSWHAHGEEEIVAIKGRRERDGHPWLKNL